MPILINSYLDDNNLFIKELSKTFFSKREIVNYKPQLRNTQFSFSIPILLTNERRREVAEEPRENSERTRKKKRKQRRKGCTCVVSKWTKKRREGEEERTRREKREIKRINGEALAKRNAGTRRRQPSPPSLHLALSRPLSPVSLSAATPRPPSLSFEF